MNAALGSVMIWKARARASPEKTRSWLHSLFFPVDGAHNVPLGFESARQMRRDEATCARHADLDAGWEFLGEAILRHGREHHFLLLLRHMRRATPIVVGCHNGERASEPATDLERVRFAGAPMKEQHGGPKGFVHGHATGGVGDFSSCAAAWLGKRGAFCVLFQKGARAVTARV